MSESWNFSILWAAKDIDMRKNGLIVALILMLAGILQGQTNLVSNGTFTGNADGWMLANQVLYNVDNLIMIGQFNGSATQEIPALRGGQPYILTYSLVTAYNLDGDGHGVQASLGNKAGIKQSALVDGFSETIIAGAEGSLILRVYSLSGATYTFVVDVSLIELNPLGRARRMDIGLIRGRY